VTDYQYDANGNRTACIQANGVTTANQFDALNRATNIANTVGSTVLYEAGYTYDLIGNRIEVNELNQQFGARQLSYGYDAKYRLVSEVWGNPATSGHSYSNTYDAAGNRLTQTKVVDGVTSVYGYSYDVLNQLNEVTLDGALHNRYTYDLNGNRATKEPLGLAGGPTQVYNWDVSDRLTTVAQATGGGAQSVLFEAGYDYRTRRVLKRESGNETVFRYDGGNAFQEHRDGAMSVEFVRGTGLGGGIGSILYSDRSVDPNGGGAVEFNVYNPVGHVVVQTDPSGNLVNASVYEAFGNIVENHKTGDQGNRLANTKERDASIGLDNHGFRYYDPEIGRYISRDPIGYGDGMNCRLYVHGNPINHIDPLGLEEDKPTLAERFSKWIGRQLLETKENDNSSATKANAAIYDRAHLLSGLDPNEGTPQERVDRVDANDRARMERYGDNVGEAIHGTGKLAREVVKPIGVAAGAVDIIKNPTDPGSYLGMVKGGKKKPTKKKSTSNSSQASTEASEAAKGDIGSSNVAGKKDRVEGDRMTSSDSTMDQLDGITNASDSHKKLRPSIIDEGDWEGAKKRPKTNKIQSTRKSEQRARNNDYEAYEDE